MSQARYLAKLASVLSAEGVIPTSKGGTGNTTGAGNSPTISAITYPGNDTAVNTAGWGRFFIVPQGDYLTEGPETFQIQLRLNSITGPVVATTPVYTINDTTTR